MRRRRIHQSPLGDCDRADAGRFALERGDAMVGPKCHIMHYPLPRWKVFNLVVTYHDNAPRRLKTIMHSAFRASRMRASRAIGENSLAGEHTPIHNAIITAKTSKE
jgi:hypothetical protein